MAVLNDFEANGYGVTALQPEHVVVLNDVPPVEKVTSIHSR
jgi:glucokinase